MPSNATSEGLTIIATAIGAFFGALSTLLISMLVEYQRKPKLSLSIENPPIDRKYDYADVKDARFINVVLSNAAMPRLFRWLGREAAVHCSVEIQFYRVKDGAEMFATPMPGRWSAADEPLSPHIMPDGRAVMAFDQTKYNSGFHRNCYPGTTETINVAAKFDKDAQCYGWSNWCYIPGKTWRIKDRELPKGRYFVKVSVYSAGEKTTAVYRLHNPAARRNFRLSTTRTEEEHIVRFLMD